MSQVKLQGGRRPPLTRGFPSTQGDKKENEEEGTGGPRKDGEIRVLGAAAVPQIETKLQLSQT